MSSYRDRLQAMSSSLRKSYPLADRQSDRQSDRQFERLLHRLAQCEAPRAGRS